ncbi:hypothetical protein ACUVZD_000081 [Pseudomonas aeruginosa]
MRLKQLHQYLGELIAAGVDPDSIVCIHQDADSDLYEVDECDFVSGHYREDPSPKMPAPLRREGTVIRLKAIGVDYAELDKDYAVGEMPVEVPEKDWPRGWGN